MAAVLFAGSGAGVAHALTQAERTSLPGLATEHDGRWDYPEFGLPALPEGAPRAFAQGNPGQVHHADLRELLLPAPEDAEPLDALPDGAWLEPEDFAALYAEESREGIADALVTHPLRHITARGWTMPDRTRTEIYLVRFTTGAVTDTFFHESLGGHRDRIRLTAAPDGRVDEEWPRNARRIGGVETTVRDSAPDPGKDHTRYAYFRAGDTLGLVIQSHPDNAAEVPFHQTVMLQAQLLG
ncbi:hypothetical protein PJ985_10325 [Streptomyces sp. ACA25]|uniref:hypothetical protein n=1 Tax=Streptomyces sp. ACA25 TaxID=3022596 RepID=UPI002307B179|nr:hypothetical protein [Streptomyces sp. ACA25]MDB1087961.1 hypothetical protein [Streptomyces sp. ACA25]